MSQPFCEPRSVSPYVRADAMRSKGIMCTSTHGRTGALVLPKHSGQVLTSSRVPLTVRPATTIPRHKQLTLNQPAACKKMPLRLVGATQFERIIRLRPGCDPITTLGRHRPGRKHLTARGVRTYFVSGRAANCRAKITLQAAGPVACKPAALTTCTSSIHSRATPARSCAAMAALERARAAQIKSLESAGTAGKVESAIVNLS